MHDEHSWHQGTKISKVLAVGIAWAALAIDMLLVTVLVPILPRYLYELDHPGQFNIVEYRPKIPNISDTNQSVIGCQYSTQDQANTYTVDYSSTSTMVGVLLALKELVQVVSNVFVGPIVDKIGCDIPLFIGYFIIIVSSAAFAFGDGYPILFIARILQGIGSSLVETASFVLIADAFRDDEERRKMLGIAMCGMSFGITIGPPFGALLYEFGGMPAPFCAIGLITIVIAALQFCIRLPRIRKIERNVEVKKSYIRLLKDHYVLLCAAVIIFGNLGIAFIEVALPLYMIRTMCAEEWMLGVAFLPISLSSAIGIIVFGWLGKLIGRWVTGFLSFFVGAAAAVAYPYCKNLAELAAPGLLLGLAASMLNVSAYPNLGYLADTRVGEAIYGGSFALGNAAYGLAFGLGPIIAGFLISGVGFRGCMLFVAGANILALIPAGLLRKALLDVPPVSDETTKLVPQEMRRESRNNGSVHTNVAK